MPDYFAPMNNALARLAMGMQYRNQQERQGRLDQQAQEQNALARQVTLADLAQQQSLRERESAARQALPQVTDRSSALGFAGQYPKLAKDFGVMDMYPNAEPSKTRVVKRGENEITEEWTPQGWIEIATSPRFNPSSGIGASPYFMPVQTADGVFSFDARTGSVSPVDVGGKPIVGSTSDPSLQGNIARAKASGKVEGETRAQAKIDLPREVQEAENTINLVDGLLKHPGLSQAVGTSSILGVQKIPGTSAKSFMVRLDQLKGKQFLQAFQGLKGGGHITEIEGEKATQAISRMDTANTEGEFIDAAREFQSIVRQGVDRARAKAEGPKSKSKADPLGIR